MTRRIEEVNRCLELRARGLGTRAISKELGVPRRTVWDWVSGRVPKRGTPTPGSCSRCGSAGHRFEDLPDAYPYLLGLYLGDGSIATHPRGVYRLRITLDARYPGIIDEAAAAMRSVMPASKAHARPRPSHDFEVSSYSKSWPCLFPQHGPGKKHLRPIVLTDWQKALVDRDPRLLLRGLIHSDGYRFMNTGRGWRSPRYGFTNLSPDIRRIFTDACDRLGLRWTTSGYVVYVSRKADVAALDGFIGPKT